jgi:hypothetical protein
MGLYPKALKYPSKPAKIRFLESLLDILTGVSYTCLRFEEIDRLQSFA